MSTITRTIPRNDRERAADETTCTLVGIMMIGMTFARKLRVSKPKLKSAETAAKKNNPHPKGTAEATAFTNGFLRGWVIDAERAALKAERDATDAENRAISDEWAAEAKTGRKVMAREVGAKELEMRTVKAKWERDAVAMAASIEHREAMRAIVAGLTNDVLRTNERVRRSIVRHAKKVAKHDARKVLPLTMPVVVRVAVAA